MNHRDDDNYPRREREWNGDRSRDDREHEWRREHGSRASFHPGGYGFDDHHTGRSSGEHSSPYGQREPYSASESGSSRDYGRGESSGRDDWRGDEWRRNEDRARYGQSRYSESQYGEDPFGQRDYGQRDYGPRRDALGEYSPRRGWSGRSTYRGSDDWDRNPSSDYRSGGDWRYGNRSSSSYGGRGPDYSYSGSPYGRPRDEDAGYARRYGVGYTGSSGVDRDRTFDDRFNRADEPRYFGTGYYAEGGSAFGGGFGEERWRSHPSSTGWLRESQQNSRFFGGGYDPQREEQRPGLLRRLFGKGPKGYQRSDERLREDVSERLMQAGGIDSSEVMVTVVSGKVTLEGTVPDRYMKHSIEDLVDACPGVQDIDNRIRVDRSAGSHGSTGYTAVSSASSTTPGSTASTGTSFGGGSGAGMSSPSSYGGSGSTGTGTASGGTTAPSGTTRSTRKDS